ncbi:hypothetical protein ACIA8F_04580 [Streptomyces sp. NPDC051563]|uniref:hypothetical protein n=1 Tax=Streptomyces sp. NPDC051563 TaxID=3365659 RepID=UPI0037A06EA1
MTTETLIPAHGYRAVFYKPPVWRRTPSGEYHVPMGSKLLYTSPVLNFAILPAAPGVANGGQRGYSLVLTRDGSVQAYSTPVGDFLGLVEPGRDPAKSPFASIAHQRGLDEAKKLHDEERIKEMTKAALDAASKENH